MIEVFVLVVADDDAAVLVVTIIIRRSSAHATTRQLGKQPSLLLFLCLLVSDVRNGRLPSSKYRPDRKRLWRYSLNAQVKRTLSVCLSCYWSDASGWRRQKAKWDASVVLVV